MVLENLLTMNYSKTLKPKLVGAPRKEKSVVHFNLAFILIGFISQERDMTVQIMVLWHNMK